MFTRSMRTLVAFAFVTATGLADALRSEAGSFTTEVVDSASFATAATLVATPSGGLVLTTGALGGTPAYYVSGGGTPFSGRVFERAGAAWQPSPAPPPVNVSLPHALAVDGEGWRHLVSWQFPVSDSSRPLLQDEGPGGWTVTVLDTSIANGLGITIDGQGRPWVAWLRGHRINCCFAPPYELLIAHRTPQGWSRDSLELPFESYFTPYPFAVDAAGRVHVLFAGAGSQGLHHAVRTAGGWETTLVDGATLSAQVPKLLAGPDGAVHALYRVGAELRYARYSAETWQVETLPFEPYPSSQSDLAIDRAGHPRIAFIGEYDYIGPCLVYARRSGSGWVLVPASYSVSSAPYRGLSLALDEFDRAAIAFQGPGYNEVSVATQAGTADVAPRVAPGAAVGLAIASGNPARRAGAILWRLSLPEATLVTLEAFDLAGRRLASSPAWPAPRGESTIRWAPAALPSGSFFVRASAAGNRSRAVQVFVTP